jgi:hypothetical protein
MATYQLTANSSQTALSPALNSTKVKVVSNAACYYAVGASPVAYNTGNCVLLPANTIRDIIVGPGTQTTSNSSAYLLDSSGNPTSTLVWSTGPVTGGTGPKITFITVAGTLAVVNITEIGFVDFNRVTN